MFIKMYFLTTLLYIYAFLNFLQLFLLSVINFCKGFVQAKQKYSKN